jgi:ABC-2 type transport system ATP-binding protein
LKFFGRLYGLRGKKLNERIQATLEIVGLTERAKSPVEKFSGGMKRRINIAAGLLHEPEILFLDEPTVGVDPQSRNAIFASVEALNAAGMTVVYTTHYMEEAQRLCDRIAIMDEGRLLALDTPAALINDLGGGLIQLGLENGHGDEVAAQTAVFPSIKSIERQNGHLIIEAHQPQTALLDVLSVTNQLNAQVTSLQVFEPNLETVFLHLTGKQLRD